MGRGPQKQNKEITKSDPIFSRRFAVWLRQPATGACSAQLAVMQDGKNDSFGRIIHKK